MCQKCIFQGSGDPNFKISPLGAHHGRTLQDTDLANNTETQSLRKTAVDKSAFMKSGCQLEKGMLNCYLKLSPT